MDNKDFEQVVDTIVERISRLVDKYGITWGEIPSILDAVKKALSDIVPSR
jgi:hypothetical protein